MPSFVRLLQTVRESFDAHVFGLAHIFEFRFITGEIDRALRFRYDLLYFKIMFTWYIHI